MKRILYVFLLFTVLSLPVFSQVQENPSGSNQDEHIITAISVTGLKKTKPYVIEKLLQKYIGRVVEDIDINDVYATIKDINILEPLSVEITGNETSDGKTLVITVHEKWTIFPIPFFFINSSSWMVGGALIDTNAFGIMDLINLGGGYGSDSWTANLMYIRSPKAVGDFGFMFMGMFTDQETEKTEQTGEDVLQRFSSLNISPGGSVSYLATELINISFHFSYQYIMLTEKDNQINAPLNDIHAFGLSPRIGLRKTSWDGYLVSEKSASLGFNYRFVIGVDDTQSVAFNAVYNHPIIPGFLVTTKAGVLYSSPTSSPFFESTLGSTVNILSSKYSVLNYAAASVGLEKYLFKFSFGTVSIAAAYQLAYSDGNVLHNQFDHGPVATLQMYFSKLAIPGIGLGAAYNVDKNNFQFAANIGMAF